MRTIPVSRFTTRRRPSCGASAGFTLIELLIVVAIIAILAAIAVPNFLEAQIRAKVSRVKADLRSVATALEAYRVDSNNYAPTPFSNPNVLTIVPTRLSTPISYISTAQFPDPFLTMDVPPFNGLDSAGVVSPYTGFTGGDGVAEPEGYDPIAGKRYYYQALQDPRRGTGAQVNLRGRQVGNGQWEMASIGPNKKRDFVEPQVAPFYVDLYDPTNGTVSAGDILRTQASSEGRR